MPSSHRNKRSALFDKSPKILGEVTVYDFANSAAPKGGRIKKALTKELMMVQVEDPLEQPTLDDEETADKVKSGRRRRRRKSSSCSSTKDDDIASRPGNIYPLDLWFLISDYIRPQDVLKFSLICKGSYHVVNTSKFWINLYKRYCRSEKVPKKLGRECLEKRHGLKPAVVQALFLACPSMAKTPNIDHDPRSVSGFVCILMWIEKTGLNDIQDSVTIASPKNWVYKFKLSKIQYGARAPYYDQKLKSYCDINANPDEGCKILTVPCREYTAVPCVSGMRLSAVKLKSLLMILEFSSAPLNTSSSQMGNISIRLSLSNGPTVFDWWHPSYHIPSPAS